MKNFQSYDYCDINHNIHKLKCHEKGKTHMGTKNDTISWKEIFLQDLLRTKDVVVYDDFEQSFDEMLKLINERSSDIINRRYRFGETYKEIGERHYIGVERVRAVIVDTLRKIREGGGTDYFTKGYEATILSRGIRTKVRENDRELEWLYLAKAKLEELEELKKMPVESLNIDEEIKESMLGCDYKVIDNLLDMDLQLLVEEIWKYKSEVISNTKRNMYIEEMGFTVATYNTLHRGGVKTLRDLVKMKRDDFRRIRNLGVCKMDEIEKVLSKYDIYIKE